MQIKDHKAVCKFVSVELNLLYSLDTLVYK